LWGRPICHALTDEKYLQSSGVEKSERKKPLGIYRLGYEDNIKMDLKEVG
jgi:hypothetical protein